MTITYNNNKTDSFFTNGPQMSLSNSVRTRLATEGLTTVADFSDFKEDQLNNAFKNMRTSIPGVPAIPEVRDANNVIQQALVPAIPATPPTLVSAKCALRLKVASTAFHYYESIGRDINAPNMNYSTVLKDFHTEYESVVALSDEKKPDVPVLHNKNNTPLKWIESFKDCLFRTYGLRKTPLLYVIRDQVTPPTEIDDPLLAGKSFVISGVFSNFSRDELKRFIETNGGKISSSLSSKTSYLVAGANMGPSKKLKAEKLNINIITENELTNLVSGQNLLF